MEEDRLSGSMRSIVFVVLFLFVLQTASRAQSSDSLRFQRYGYVIGSVLAFSFADYVMYNHLRADAGWPGNFAVSPLYRIVQGVVQAGITYVLYEKFGLPSAISFNLLQWTGVTDWMFNAWQNSLQWIKPPGPLGPPGANTWMGWTPVGIVRPLGSPIPQNTLNAQAAVGFSIGMTILW